MSPYVLEVLATESDFDEEGYLQANPDVKVAVERGECVSGQVHFHEFGKREKRKQRRTSGLARLKAEKRKLIRPILRTDMPMVEANDCFDFLTAELRKSSNIIDTDLVASNEYQPDALDVIERHKNGLVLDCGAGRRREYYSNIVNFEIVAYDTTDVRGVGEALPFKDNSFDAVLSLAVLEHVKDPFQCAREIIRVLKPGGELHCCVPFLQPMHGYPNHYYNMTEQGIRNLFESGISIRKHEVAQYSLPIWTLTWILNSWASGLSEKTRSDFLNMKVSDLLDHPTKYFDKPFVTELSDAKNFELACGSTITGTKLSEVTLPPLKRWTSAVKRLFR
ncbi:methyltransferase domain-containing protein [Burkholderia multivorans]|uniref:methyltransferase domain-containing protein n=1 Tax=Burkholderia multivorans TaxID=87883 RepID=UPI0021BF8BDC|nr:methyltransferase domain-containing protein [Burkholderia multivorans]MDR9177896.1 putative methyltransferase [Burkholderia multivorans]MDR9184018.1 putative methyltransferase [Burkholderia multivorans]MDR9187490.1 putative methyltransferase [Burkholderia multivorans]MDR9195226.1 putative methyltransferase [Burkholderia multivorans]MDR9200922.1 putative methyltransferase [Burkholderia multivorans]